MREPEQDDLILGFIYPVHYPLLITLFPETFWLTDELEPQEEFSASS